MSALRRLLGDALAILDGLVKGATLGLFIALVFLLLAIRGST